MLLNKTWKVNFYQNSRGDYPVLDFIYGQNEKISAKIFTQIQFLRLNGPFLKPPQIKKIKNDLYELRIKGNISYRIFYVMINEEYYLLHIFKKKSQKTPRKEIKIAIDRLKELI